MWCVLYSIVYFLFITSSVDALEPSRSKELQETLKQYIAERFDDVAISDNEFETRLASFAVSARSIDQLRADFDKYLLEYGLTFSNYDEYARRFEIFRRRLDIIDLWNMSPENSEPWSPKLSVNHFAHLDETELLPYRSGSLDVKSDDMENIYQGVEETTMDTLILNDAEKAMVSQESFNWADKKGYVTPVKSQAMCGSCSVYAATAAFETLWAIRTGGDVNSEITATENPYGTYNGAAMLTGFSEQYVLDCIAKKIPAEDNL